ncbi:hypothetical protein D9756_002590 [Leucocoprinus leucothites]|uniref:Protein kinase domain-containing protein n=1 Tax=Leucocoprinus leucothites TaxID=201217 RepID=A0A8H5GBH8_9AGAR|nr:hypothetical protein D9756_002590 [Leucoagaricus leucothites]
MDPLPSPQGSVSPTSSILNESDVFSTLHHLVSRIDAESRVEEVAEKAQSLGSEAIQLLIDCLSMAIDRDAAPLKSRAFVWRLLVKVASSAKVFARNHTLSSEHISPESDSPTSDTYTVSGKAPVRVKKMRGTSDDSKLFTEALISWVHLSHPNVLPLYAIFNEGENHPYLVSPYTMNRNIRDYIQDNPDISQMLLISDVVNGLSCMHQLDIIHGGLNPENVLISIEGRAVITNLDSSDPPPVRYSAPELVADEGNQPTKATNMWAFACLCYELLSGTAPFCHIAKEFRVAVTIAAGGKPNRPGQGGVSGNAIDDALWQIMLMCWEFEPEDRPTCLTVQQIFLGIDTQDDRPALSETVQSKVVVTSTIDFEHTKASLMGVLGSDHSPSLRVPEHLRKMLSSFVPDTAKLNETVAAAKKFSPNDTQMFLDLLDLVLEDLPNLHQDPVCILLSSIIPSTHIIPYRYKLNGIQYDPTPVYEGPHVKVYKGRGPNVRVNVTTRPWLIKGFLTSLPDWSQVSHPNVIPFHGVFQEGTIEGPRFCVVTTFWENGNLEDYALTLPQNSRIPLILDVINAIAYLHSEGIGFKYFRKEHVMISEAGRAALACFNSAYLFEKEDTSSTRELRYSAPNVDFYNSDNIWSFGCLCYKLLSRNEPYYQYAEDAEIRSAVSEGQLPKQPDNTDDGMEKIDDQWWGLITKCCSLERGDRPTALQAKEQIISWGKESNLPLVKGPPETNFLAMRSRPNLDFHLVEALLRKIQVELLRSPLSKLLQNHIKDVAQAATELEPDDTRTLVDFLDLALKDHLSVSGEQNRVLAALSRITSSTHIFPQNYELRGIKYHSQPMAEGGYGTVHRGTDINVCVKVMTQVDPKALTPWIRELILWAHVSHPNILPFCGMLLENVNNHQRICLVSPFMKNGNLHDYAPRLPQKSRLPLILDVINGLHYLHVLGIVHSDLKGENVLISNQGRCLITDFGTTQITTATASTTTSLVPTTLRFAAPEVVLSSGPPTKERDIWSFGCLCYEVLSRQVPYHQYAQTVQVSAALARKELPRRPGSTANQNPNDDQVGDDWDDSDEDDWDEIDDQAWNLITGCCAPEPEDRLDTSAIQELIVDMKIWDDRPAAKPALGIEVAKLRVKSEIDLNRVGELLDKLQKSVVPAEEDGEFSFVDLFNSLVRQPS